jgi:hypothetical protein
LIIKSQWKDYYDYIAYQYGGGDPKIVYSRNRISPLRRKWIVGAIVESNSEVEMEDKFPLSSLRDLVPFDDYYKRRVAYLVVAGKAYLLMKEAYLYNDDVNTFRVQPLNAFDEFNKRHSRRWFVRHDCGELGKEYPFFVELSRKVKAPVFVIRNMERKFGSDKLYVQVAGQCPILKEIGMPALIPATQMYQDLAYFVGNTMKEHPDTEPPVEVSNNCKIVNAGFDLKQSFRHRVKE